MSRVTAGAALVLLTASVGAASAQEDAGEPLAIEGSTLYVAPLTDALPPTLTTSVPPAAVCVVAPELCPEATDDIRAGIVSGIGAVQDAAVDAPVQPVPADTAAVSYLGGAPRYATALRFEPPPVPAGDDVLLFELTFPQAQPTYHSGSPAFRRAILATFEAIATRDPAVFGEGLAAALAEDPIDTSTVMGFEACPFTEPFEVQGAPEATDAAAMPTRDEDGEDVPAVDCTFGGNGVYDETAGVWRVDLAFTAQAWADGDLAAHGVLLRPTGAPNLAFGDGDTSTTAQVALDLTEVTYRIETAEPFDPGEFAADDVGFDGPPADDGVAGEGFAGDESFGAGGFDDAEGFDVGSPADVGELGDVPVEDTAPLDEAVAAPEVGLDARAAEPVRAGPTMPWWVWTVALPLLGGAWLTGSALTAPLPAAAAPGGGALTRLLERHAAGAGTSGALRR